MMTSPFSNARLAFISAILAGHLLTACDDGVLTFPTPDPALVRIINTTQDVSNLTVVIDESKTVTAARGTSADTVRAAAGRPIGFVLKEESTDLRRDTLFYTLGGDGRIILFARGSKANVVEFRRVIQDTVLAPSDKPVIRFTHMAESVDLYVSLEVWIKGGDQLFGEIFDPGLSSKYEELAPGTYSFELREAGTTNIVAVLNDVQITAGRSYMLYSWDTAPPAIDQVSFSYF
ncbi:MAG: hypothetical protein EHM43_11315 [Ignavibacteriae bacterium]|nr:MAG: hypothetical protein EHM43_11315 [Ignavibacteriota bacterium]